MCVPYVCAVMCVGLFTALVGGWCEPWRVESKNEVTKVSRSSQLCSDHQAVYTLTVKKKCTTKVFNHKVKPQMEKCVFP